MTPEIDGFYGAYYPNDRATDKAVILMLGDSSDDRMAVSGAKWVHMNGCHALCMSPDKKDYGHHSYPIERFGAAIGFLKSRGIKKIGIAGASTTGMLALVAASYYPEITLTIAISPSDFIMAAFYQDGKDGMRERPGDNESTVTWQGKQLPYLPYAYRHPEYWMKIQEASKAGRDMVASRPMFDESERLHPLQEEEKIKVERIRGTSFSSAPRTMSSGIPASTYAGWKSASTRCRMTAPIHHLRTSSVLILPSRNRC